MSAPPDSSEIFDAILKGLAVIASAIAGIFGFGKVFSGMRRDSREALAKANSIDVRTTRLELSEARREERDKSISEKLDRLEKQGDEIIRALSR